MSSTLLISDASCASKLLTSISDCVVVVPVPLDGEFLSMLIGLAGGVFKDEEEMVDMLCVVVDGEW